MEGKFSPAFCFPENGDSGTLKQTRSGNSHQHDMTENETFEKVDFHEMELDDEYYGRIHSTALVEFQPVCTQVTG